MLCPRADVAVIGVSRETRVARLARYNARSPSVHSPTYAHGLLHIERTVSGN